MDIKSFHLERQPAPEALLTGVGPKGEFHGNALAASGDTLAGVTSSGEIHLESQCASEGILAGVAPTGEIHLKRERHYDSKSIERMMVSERREYLREVKDKLLAKQYDTIP